MEFMLQRELEGENIKEIRRILLGECIFSPHVFLFRFVSQQTNSTNLRRVAGLVIYYVSSLLTPAVIISFLPVHAVIRLSQKPLNDSS